MKKPRLPFMRGGGVLGAAAEASAYVGVYLHTAVAPGSKASLGGHPGKKRAKKMGATIPQSEVEKPWERLDGGDGMIDGEEEEEQQQEEQHEEHEEEQEEEEEEELQNNSRGSLDKEEAEQLVMDIPLTDLDLED
jgi:hypothetical protein